LSLHKTDAGKADYRNERKKFGSHNGESREATGLWSTHFPYGGRMKEELRIMKERERKEELGNKIMKWEDQTD
jgi:hypothetical protein